jgi:hypothetical protein
MSVDIAGNPWTFAQDGVGTNPVGFVYKQYVDIRDMVITKATTNGSRIHVTDINNRQIVDFVSEPGDTSFRVGKLGLVNGLKIDVFDEGELTIAV